MFYRLTEKEHDQRTDWFGRHSYIWLGKSNADGYKYVLISLAWYGILPIYLNNNWITAMIGRFRLSYYLIGGV